LNTSARHDNYSDFGGADTYKANARWKASNIAVVRASLGTGFRAPSLTSLWTPQTTGTSAQFTDPKFPNMTSQQVQEVSGGNPNLQPEKSKQKSIGLVLTPVKNLTIGIDAWNIEIDGKITSASAQETVSRFRSGDAAYAGLVTLNPATGMVDQVKSVFANIGTASYSGIDLNAAYKMNLESGTLGLSMYGTYMNKADETSPSGTVSRKVGTMVESNGDPVIGADSGGVIVKWKHLLSVSYETGPWRYTLGQNFYTGYRTGDRQLDGEPNYVPNQTTYNAQVSYSGVKNLKLTLGVKNLFDKNPPIYVPASNQFASGYDISMYDPRARFVYLSANYKFN
jgi:iron complex outermembrane receptor protein